jgi:hypothetical protein
MLRSISVAAACVTMLGLGALPASAATSPLRTFSIPGVYGVRAWGIYYDIGQKVRVTVCVQDTAQGVYGAGAVGLAFTPNYRRHSTVNAVTVGYGHSQCHSMLSPYTGNLVVEAFSGYKNGHVREHGRLKRIY